MTAPAPAKIAPTSPLPLAVASPTTVHKTVGFDDVKAVVELRATEVDVSAFIIDVRGRAEREKDGCIPNSHNLPLDEVEAALQLPPAEFNAKYGFCIKEKDTPLVVHCWSGMRAQRAFDAIHAAGYTHVKVFTGSYKAWYEAHQPKSEEEVKK